MRLLPRLLLLGALCSILLSGTPSVYGQSNTDSKPFALTIDNIMRGEALIGFAPRNLHWSHDSKRLYFDWKRAGTPAYKEYDHYVVNADGTGIKPLSEEEIKALPPEGDLAPDKHRIVYTEDGDVYIYDRTTGKRRQLTATTDIESNPRFLPDGKRIVFERGGNLFLLSLVALNETEGSPLRQLTDIRRDGATEPPVGAVGGFRAGGGGAQGSQGRQGRGNGGGAGFGGGSRTDFNATAGVNAPPRREGASSNQDLLKQSARELFETVRDRQLARDEQNARRKQPRARRKAYSLAAGQTAFGLQLSNDTRYVSFTVREGAEGRGTIVTNYVTESGYAEDMPGRTLVGDVQGRSHMVVIDTETGEAKRVDFTPPPLKAVGVKEGDRPLNWFNWQWSEDGKRAVVMARSTDNKDLWILSVDPATGNTTVLENTHDDAWVGGPGTFALGFLPDNRHIYFISERDGFAHLYTASTDPSNSSSNLSSGSQSGSQSGTSAVSADLKQLTQGRFEVTQVQLSEDKRRFYIHSSEDGPAERYLYTLPIEGGNRTRVTRLTVVNEDRDSCLISPDERMVALVRSEPNRPPELYLVPNRPNAKAVHVTHSPTAEWLSYPWMVPPIVSLPTRDGKSLAARLYKPDNWKAGGPAVIFVHGAGYLQNVHNSWSYYYHEYMFHHLLKERGYLVLDADYRGSAGYGRDWRTGIYRHMGGKDLDDEVDAARWLVSNQGVDPKRIGLYGGSYGGFLTLMALFTAPDVFRSGAALRPVTDWAHYNHGYTANILNEPQNDPEAYRRSSPIYFAEGLKGNLLICHGMVDDNVLFQDSVLLTQRLIELRKENWDLAAYPVENHSFTQPTSWADEYKRILKLFESTLK